ncbi:triose-phosphate isomerase [bacterium]|nr:triose-phosphate isomerase [bacterium]
MRERIIAGNWKMNTLPEEGAELAHEVAKAVKDIDNVKIVICPPATHLCHISNAIKGSNVGLGAQNVHWEEKGAFTGEVSTSMLKALGCQWVIIGHSERRQMFGETDEGVNKRLRHIVKSNIRPIVCIGETLEERQAGDTFKVLERQIRIGFEGVEMSGNSGVVIAYEPVWAIGTGLTATPEQAQEAHHFIRELLSEMYGSENAAATVIQYGGSMNEKNADVLMSCEDVDGGLIGGASLKPESFAAIVNASSMI